MIFWEKPSRELFFGEGGYSAIAKVALPLIIMNASHALMQFADRYFLAMNSPLDLAAAMPGGLLYFAIYSFFMIVTEFSAAVVAQLFGAKRHHELMKAVYAGIYFAALSGLFIYFIVPPVGHLIIRSGGHEGELLTRELIYFDSLLFSGIFSCFSVAFFAFFNGRGKTRPAAVINITACLLNVVLDYAMIFGKFGFPAMGIKGAGIATTISSGVSFVLVISLFFLQDQKEYATRKILSPSLEYMKKLVVFGSPSGMRCFIDVGTFCFITFALGKLGKEALAASTIALAVNNILFVPMLGISDATGILSGQAIGSKNSDGVEKIAFRCWRLAVCYMALGALCYLLFPEKIVELFAPRNGWGDVDVAAVTGICVWVLRFAVIFNFSDCFKFVFMGALRGAGDTKMIFVIASSCAVFLLLPIIWFSVYVYNLGAVKFWGILTVYYVVEAALLYSRFACGAWKKIKLVEINTGEVPVQELGVKNP